MSHSGSFGLENWDWCFPRINSLSCLKDARILGSCFVSLKSGKANCLRSAREGGIWEEIKCPVSWRRRAFV